MATLRHVQSGEPIRIRASDWNRIVDATRAHFEQQGKDASKPATAGNAQASVILVRNDSGADRERFDVLGIDEPIIGPADNAEEFKRAVTVKGITPSRADHAGKFVVLQEPLKAGAIGRGVVAGVTVARLSVNHGSETHAEVADAEAGHLQAGGQGSAQVLYLAGTSGTPGTVLGIVRFGAGAVGINRFRARSDGHSAIGANRWSYTVVEVAPDLDGKFKDVPGGRTGTAFNTFEANNGSTGIQGSGDDQADLDVAGVSLKPIGPAVFWVDVDLDCDGNEIWFFEAPNNPGGQCAS